MVGEQWRDMWMERLEHLEPLIVTILENQAYGDFWRERAVTDFSRIKCPVYAVSGWAAASYVGAVFQTIQAVAVPWKALVGPWGHRFAYRSEEHTSELQSLMRTSYAVFCLNKKKQNTITQ